jgi:hypothetical protein
MPPVINYTNGFNSTEVLTAMRGRLGWRQSLIPGEPVVDVANAGSKSGRYFNDAHALVTASNYRSVLDLTTLSDAEFNTELARLQDAVIMQALNGIFSEREYIDQVLLYDYQRTNRAVDYVENAGNFAGMEIAVAASFDKAVQIEAVVLLFDEAVTFPLYLYKAGKKTPIWEQEVTAVAFEETIVNLESLILKFSSETTKGSLFYFGYFQEDLGTARAINQQNATTQVTHIFGATPFYAKQLPGLGEFENTNLFRPGFSMGLNLQVVSFSDWTGLIIKKANLFDELIALVMAYNVIEKIVYSVASNGTQRVISEGINKAAAMQVLNGSAPVSDGPPPITGLNKRIEREAARVKKSFFPAAKAQIVKIC